MLSEFAAAHGVTTEEMAAGAIAGDSAAALGTSTLEALANIDEADRRELIAASSGGGTGGSGGSGGSGGGGSGGDGAGSGGGGDVSRERYTPADDDWISKEDALLAKLRADDEEKQRKLEEELPGSDEILIKGGFRVQDQNSAAVSESVI